jgi:hypothetical protein
MNTTALSSISIIHCFLSALLLASYQALSTNATLNSTTLAPIVNLSQTLIADTSPLFTIGLDITAFRFTEADKVWIAQVDAASGDSQLGFLTLPARLSTGQIRDQPVYYFQNTTRQLSISSSDIQLECESPNSDQSTLSLDYFLPKPNSKILTV